MATPRPQVLLSGRCMIIHDQHLLLVKRASNDRYRPGAWEFPGGKANAGEDLEHSLLREIEEETGLLVRVIERTVYNDSYVIRDGSDYDGATYVVIFNIARVTSGSLRLSNEHSSAEWVTPEEAKTYDLTPESREALRVAMPLLKRAQFTRALL